MPKSWSSQSPMACLYGTAQTVKGDNLERQEGHTGEEDYFYPDLEVGIPGNVLWVSWHKANTIMQSSHSPTWQDYRSPIYRPNWLNLWCRQRISIACSPVQCVQPAMEEGPVSQDNTKIIMIPTVAYQACRKSNCHSSTTTLRCPTAQRKSQISHPDHTEEMHQHLIILLLL